MVDVQVPVEIPVTRVEPYFAEERKGWHGYVEWEDYPEKRAEAARILATHDFAHVSLLIVKS